MNNRIVINITLSMSWRRRPVGLVRVERELIKHLNLTQADRLCPVYLDLKTKTWRGVRPDSFKEILHDDWVHSDNPERDHNEKNASTTNFKPNASDSFVSVGSDWSFDVPARVAETYSGNRVLIPACYDLIPLLFPEFTPTPEFATQFDRHYSEIAKIGRAVFAISENSKRDLLDFWKQKGLSRIAPPVEVIPLAGFSDTTRLPLLDKADQALLENIRSAGDYVIYVSTLEPRKNHQLLLDVWRELYAERGQNCPQLLVIGMHGWGTDNLIQQMGRMDATRGMKICWLQGVVDDLLAHLYANSLFAVFPSFYEGWGLAATEAAAFGKVCIVSNNSALEEATHGLAPAYHPLDFPGWSKEIRKLMADNSYRKDLENTIVANAPRRTWSQFAKHFSETFL